MAASGPRPLEGVKVLDLSRVLAGPWCTQILADFGADVIKIESPGVGDDTRAWGPPNLPKAEGEQGNGESAYYLCCNRNKRSLAINIADKAGADIIRKLAVEAHIVVENFKLGGLKKYGLDFESLKKINPKLVYCSITGFGQTGPYASRPGYDFVVQAMGGFMSITGDPAGPPTRAGVAIADVATGLYAAVSVLVALRHAERTGVGQQIDLALLDTQMTVLANQSLTYLVDGTVPGRLGNAHPTIVPYRVFDAADGPFVIAVGNDGQFKLLCDVLGASDLAADPRFTRNVDRVRHREILEPTVEALTRKHPRDHLLAELTKGGVPCGPVNTIAQAFQDPFIQHRKTVHHFTRDDGVDVPTVTFPGKLSETPAENLREPPRLGEHTFDTLKEWLTISDGELQALQAAGVVMDRDTMLANLRKTGT